jgi:glycosyltransferase involved in cell wall biosynthesis
MTKHNRSPLEGAQPQKLDPEWRRGAAHVLSDLQTRRAGAKPARRKRIAVILPRAYRGGTLRGSQLLARAIKEGSERAGEAVAVVLAHLDVYQEREFSDIGDVLRRPFAWRRLDRTIAERAMRYASLEAWQAKRDAYWVADDGVDNLMSCDLWIVVSDRVPGPLLPLRPQIMMIYDYLQRYVPFQPEEASIEFIAAARAAERVLVTTNWTERDALQYAGIEPGRVAKVPMLAPDFTHDAIPAASFNSEHYFLWSTNGSMHKNHDVAMRALQHYYDRLGGALKCYVTGANSASIPEGEFPHHVEVARRLKGSAALRENVQWLGELDDESYRAKLAGAAFLWHPARIDNGTFSVIEAAGLGVPSLSSDYGPMREIDRQFELNLAWAPSDDFVTIAERLKEMEATHLERRQLLPGRAMLSRRCYADHVDAYWRVVRQCL